MTAGSKYTPTRKCAHASVFIVCDLIRPQNTRYVVVSGARKKEEDWNPEENGGYAVHGECHLIGDFHKFDL